MDGFDIAVRLVHSVIEDIPFEPGAAVLEVVLLENLIADEGMDPMKVNDVAAKLVHKEMKDCVARCRKILKDNYDPTPTPSKN